MSYLAIIITIALVAWGIVVLSAGIYALLNIASKKRSDDWHPRDW